MACGKHTSGLKARINLDPLMPGLKPKPTFFKSCNIVNLRDACRFGAGFCGGWGALFGVPAH